LTILNMTRDTVKVNTWSILWWLAICVQDAHRWCAPAGG